MNLILVCGTTGSGKSNFVNKVLLRNNIKKINVQGREKDNYFISPHSRQQYVFDLNNEYSFPEDTRPGKQIRHLQFNMKMFLVTAKTLKNYNIIFEDATGFLRGKQAPEIIQMIVARRHTNNNFIILFHAIENIPPELMRMTNYLFLFKTGDNLKAIDKKFANEKLNAAFARVNKAPKYYMETIKIIE